LPKSDDYHAKAVHCVQMAQEIEDPDSKALLLEMAQAWIKLLQYVREKERERAN
jgi:hypothetical protein